MEKKKPSGSSVRHRSASKNGLAVAVKQPEMVQLVTFLVSFLNCLASDADTMADTDTDHEKFICFVESTGKIYGGSLI